MTGRHSADGAPAEDPSDPADRGALRIEQLALRRIVQQAADLVPETTSVRRKIVGVDAGQHGATARVIDDGETVDVRLDLALHYPNPVRRTVATVRERVADDLLRITGKRVRAVEVTVSALLPDVQPRVE